MAYLLHIETATNVCSVALSNDNTLIHFKEIAIEHSHASKLTTLIQELFSETELALNSIDGVCISKGPGSYTGLRIGTSVAKGLCYALDMPLLAVNTLTSLTYGFIQTLPESKRNTFICPMLDARRMEVYTALYNYRGVTIQNTKALILNPGLYEEYAKENTIYFIGNGAYKFKEIFDHSDENRKFYPDFNLSARWLVYPAYQKFIAENIEDIAYFEPFYLKEFITTKAKKSVFS